MFNFQRQNCVLNC